MVSKREAKASREEAYGLQPSSHHEVSASLCLMFDVLLPTVKAIRSLPAHIMSMTICILCFCDFGSFEGLRTRVVKPKMKCGLNK